MGHDVGVLSATHLHQRGLELSHAGRLAAARQTLRRALERAEDEDTRARIELSLAYTESETGTAEDGLRRCQQALTRTGVTPHVQGLVWSQLGMLQMRAGDGRASLEAFSRAGELLTDDAEALGNLHLNRGNVYLQRNLPQEASADFETSLQAFERVGLVEARDKARHNLGYARLLAGDLAAAVHLMDQARPTFDGLGPVAAAVADQDRSEALIAAGMPHDAAVALRAASSAFARRRMCQRQAEALLVLARLLLRDDPQVAGSVARRAMRLFAGRGSLGWATRAEAVSIAAAVLAGSHDPRLIERAQAVATRLRDHGLPHDAEALQLYAARLAIRGGDQHRAQVLLGSQQAHDDAPLDNRLLAREVRADLAEARNHRSDALTHVRKGLDELHGWQSSFGSLDLQSSLVGHGRHLALTGIGLALQDGRPELVLEWADRARALATRVAPVRPPADREVDELLRELRVLTAQIAASEGRPSAARLRQARLLRNDIRQRAWHDPGSGRVSEPASLAEVQARLAPNDGVLLAHLVVHDRLHLLTVTQDAATVSDLGDFRPVRRLLQGLQADMDMSAAHLPIAFRQLVAATLEDRLATLAARLVDPVTVPLVGRPVALVAPGALAGTPWSLLPGLTESPLTLPPSPTWWVRRRPPAGGDQHAGFVAGPRVARSPEEIGRASQAWPSARCLDPVDASAARVSALAAECDVLHLAAHGRHSADNPLFSALELSDGPWFGYDIDRLPSVPATVVLSACELGRSSVRWGEETIGMTAAWLHAGSRVVIAAPASVDDDVACEVLSAAHARLAAGQPASYALAGATAALDAPSSFMCFGAGW